MTGRGAAVGRDQHTHASSLKLEETTNRPAGRDFPAVHRGPVRRGAIHRGTAPRSASSGAGVQEAGRTGASAA